MNLILGNNLSSMGTKAKLYICLINNCKNPILFVQVALALMLMLNLALFTWEYIAMQIANTL